MLAFVGPPPDGMEVAHENGRRADCRLANLSYKTKAANQADRIRHGTACLGEKNPTSKLTSDAVCAIRRLHGTGGMSQRALAAQYGVSRRAIQWALTGRTWKHVGG